MTRIDWKARLQEELDRPPFKRWLAAVVASFNDDDRRSYCRTDLSSATIPPRKSFMVAFFQRSRTWRATLPAVAVFHGSPAPTIALQIDYLVPAIGKAVHARGILRKLGRSISHADVKLRCSDKLVAIARGSFSTREIIA
jgi:hypothetical protein